MNYLLTIKGDTNDADYITKETALSEEQMKEVRPLLDKFKPALGVSKKGWNSSEYADDDESTNAVFVETGLLTEEEVEQIYDYVPHGEYGIHSIESIKLYTIADTEILY